MADSLFSRAIWFDLYSFLAHRGLSFAMKMHKQLCHGEGRVLTWCFALKGIISSWHGSGFSFKWFLEADRTCYECGLAIFVFLDEGLTETRLFVMQSRCYKTQSGWKECAGSWHSDLNRVASSSGTLLSLPVNPVNSADLILESLLRVQVLEVWVNHPTLPRGSKGVQGAWKYVVWVYTTSSSGGFLLAKNLWVAVSDSATW